MTEEQVFLAALDLPNPDHRSAYLDSVCGADTDLRRQVDGLLAAHFKSGEFLNEPVGEQLGTAPIIQGEETLVVACQSNEEVVADRPNSDPDSDSMSFLEPATRPDSLGRIGHYETLQVLGKGGFGIVFRAFDDVLQRVVALKVLAPAIAATSPARKRFLREAQASARVRHENVVQVHAVEEAPIPYLVMEFIAGETLQERLDRKGPLEAVEIVHLARQVAEGLAAAHATGLIHRDIKPGNILIEGGTHERVKITDFGLARAADDASMTQSGVVAGTPMFMSPEQAQGETLDQRSDLFSLGSVMYAMASGRPPFRAATTFAVLKRVVEETPRDIKDIIPETPQWLCDIIGRLQEKKPENRFQTAREVADLLADCEQQLKAHNRVQDLAQVPRREVTTGRTTTPHRLRTAAIVFAMVVLIAGLIWSAPTIGLVLKGKARVDCLTRDGDTQVEFVSGDLVVGKQVGYGELMLPSGNYELRVTKPDPNLRIYNAVVLRRNWLGMYEQVTLSSPPKNLQLNAGDRVGFMVAYVRQQADSAPSLRQVTSNEWVDVIPLIEPQLDKFDNTVTGKNEWHIENGELLSANTDGKPSKLILPLDSAWNAFECEVEFTRTAGMGGFNINLPTRYGECPVVLGIADKPGIFLGNSKSGTAINTQIVLPSGERTKLRIEVRPYEGRDEVNVSVNDVAAGSWTGDFAATAMTYQEGYPHHRRISLFVRNGINDFCFHRIRIRLLEGGTAVSLRPVTSAPFHRPEHFAPTFKNSLGMEFVKVPKGKSWLGGGKDKLGDREVEIPADFYLGKYEVTQEEWEKVMGENPSHFSRTGEGKDAVKDVPDADLKRFPVEHVSWDQCQEFVAKLNEREKGTEWVYRLPTEAEWEYACRGGPMADKAYSAFDFYLTEPTNALAPDQASIYGKGLKRTCKVGLYEPNVLGLYDMYGNVREWCADTHHVPDASHRVNRGGGWDFGSVDCQTADRKSDPPSWVAANLGLRLARVRSGAPSPEAKTPPLAVSPFNAAQAQVHQEAWAKYLDVPVEYTNGIGMKFRLIPPGEFMMGATEEEIKSALVGEPPAWLVNQLNAEGPQRRTTVPAPFYLGQLEVTLGQFRQFVRETGYKTTAETNGKGGTRLIQREGNVSPENVWSSPTDSPTEDHPVVFVSIEDARQFCTWLGKKDGRTYALPREDQWEFACRAGTTTPWFSGDDKADVLRVAWVAENSEQRLQPCGRKDANAFGLHDMLGNAEEICETVAPQLPARRGGGAQVIKDACRSASRHTPKASTTAWYRGGFRVAIIDLKPATTSLPRAAVAQFTDADAQRIAALPAEQQVAAVVASFKERNPSLNGTATHKIVDGVVTEFNFNPTDDQNALTDLSPVRALAGLTSLNLWNCSALADLGPLQGLPLTRLTIGSLDVSNQVRDLKPLQGMRLTELQLYQCQVEDLKPLAGMPLNRLTVFSRHVRNCEPLKGMPLTTLDLSYCTQIQDFTPLTGLPLTVLRLNACQIRDLQPLSGLNLTEVSLAGTRVQDLQQLKGMPLKNLAIQRTGVTDLTPLQGMELKEIFLSPKTITQGLNHLREMQSLRTIGIGYASTEKWPAVEFWDRYDKEEFAPVPFTEADVQRIAALPAEQRVEEIRKELMRLNPKFDGKVRPTIVDNTITEFAINTDNIENIAPLRAIAKLVYLDLRGTYPNKGKLSDLSPLQGMAISRLDCSSTQVSDLSPLADMPLEVLHFNHNPVTDLTPLKKMPLESLGLAETKVTDLSPLRGLKLKVLGAQLIPVTDLSPLTGMPLTGIDLYHTIGVTSLEPLRGMPLEGINLQDVPVSDLAPLKEMTTLRTLLLSGNKVSDLSPLAGLKLTDLILHGEQITDFSPLKGMQLTRLIIDESNITDLRPLEGMPLVEFRFQPHKIKQGLDVVRGIKSLTTIGVGVRAWPAEEFWQRYDEGEFGK